MRVILVFLIAIAFSVNFINAQTDFRPGYVLKTETDTLFGEIDYRTDKLMSEVCTFRANVKDTIQYFYPTDIYAFRFIDSKYFVSRKIKDKQVFLEFLVKGKLNFYFLNNGINSSYYFDKDDLELTELPYSEGIKTSGNVNYSYATTTHVGLLTYYLQDAQSLKPEIEKIKKPDHKKLIKLANDYHSVICDGEKCIVYEKKLPTFKVYPEIVSGAFLMNNTDPIRHFSIFQAGVLAHIWMPSLDEKFFFKTGLIFSNLTEDNLNLTIVKLPLQIEYLYPSGVFRPRLAAGLCLYSIFENSRFVISPGFLIKVNKYIQLGLNYDWEYSLNVNGIMPIGDYEGNEALAKSVDSLYGGIYFTF